MRFPFDFSKLALRFHRQKFVPLQEIDENLSREEVRRKRRQKEAMQAYAAVGGAAVAVVVFLIVIIHLLTGGKSGKQEAKAKQSQQPRTKVEQASESAQNTEAEQGEEESDIAKQVAEAAAREEAKEAEENPVPDEVKILDEVIAGYLKSMSLEEKVAALFMVQPEQLMNTGAMLKAGGDVSDALSQYPVGGILFTEKNMKDGDQFLELVSNMRTYCNKETFMAVAEEGGKDSPFYKKKLVEEVTLSQSEIGKQKGVADAYSVGIEFGQRLRAFGLDMNLAPVTDVVLDKGSAITSRSFGDDQEDVITFSKSVMNGMIDQYVRPVIKYFPSYGDVKTDGTAGEVVSKRTLEDLQKNEMEVYKQMIQAGANIIMVSEVEMPEITGDDTPACFSEKIVTDLLRKELEFDGIVMTDYVNKGAINKTYKQSAVAVEAVKAGCDMIVAPGKFKDEYNGLLKAVQDGEITEERIEESVYRIYRVKYKNLIDYENYTPEE